MKLKFLKEKELISAIREDFSVSHPGMSIGIGDDAAVIQFGKSSLIVTKDLLVENYHFKLPQHPAFFLGRKSLNVNISDIAAMGGTPQYALLGLGIPSSVGPRWVEDFFSGLQSAAKDQNIILAGGDVTQAKKVFISVTLLGEGRNVIQRNGAKPGDSIFVSGTLGDSKQGLLLMMKGIKLGEGRESDFSLKAFFDPVPQVSLGKELSRLRLASSMIDISDGLSVDLGHLCEESRCGAEIHLDALPLSQALRSLQKKLYWCALHGGEDYQLLFTVSPKKAHLISRLQRRFQLTRIGRMNKGNKIIVIDKQGRKRELPAKGYQHFKNKPVPNR